MIQLPTVPGIPTELQPLVVFVERGTIRQEQYQTILHFWQQPAHCVKILYEDVHGPHHTESTKKVKQALGYKTCMVPKGMTGQFNVGDFIVHRLFKQMLAAKIAKVPSSSDRSADAYTLDVIRGKNNTEVSKASMSSAIKWFYYAAKFGMSSLASTSALVSSELASTLPWMAPRTTRSSVWKSVAVSSVLLGTCGLCLLGLACVCQSVRAEF